MLSLQAFFVPYRELIYQRIAAYSTPQYTIHTSSDSS